MNKNSFAIWILGSILLVGPLGVFASGTDTEGTGIDAEAFEGQVKNIDLLAAVKAFDGSGQQFLMAKAQAKGEAKADGSLSLSQKQVEDLINEAALYAVRQEEQYVLMSLKSSLAATEEELESLREEKSIWIKASVIEGAVILLGFVAVGISLSRK